MQAAYLQTFLLMTGLYLIGAFVGYLLRRLFQGAGTRTAAATVQAGHAVEPLPEYAAPAGRTSVAGPSVSRFERALAGEQVETPRAAPTPQPAPAARAVEAAAEPAPAAKPAPQAAPAAPAIAATIATAAAAARAAPAAAPAAAPSLVVAEAAAAPAAPKPAAGPDDLTRINGIDSGLAKGLADLGVRRFTDIARWMRPDVVRVSEALGLKGRIEQQNWIEQAQILANGGETSFTRQLAARTANSIAALAPAVPAPAPAPAAAPPPPAPTPAAAAQPAPPAASPSQAAAAVAAALAAAAAATRQAVAPAVHEKAAFAEPREARPAIAAPSPAPAPAASPAPPAVTPIRPAAIVVRDNLQRISGINAEVERRLNDQGITRYSHVAAWGAEDVSRLEMLFGSQGRIRREQWVEQAALLARGGETPASRDIDRRAASEPAIRTEPRAEPRIDPKIDPKPDAAARPARLSDAILQKQGQPATPPRTDISGLRSVRSEAYQARPVDAATAAAAAAAAAAGSAKVLRSSEVDDLKRIRGVGVLIEKRLNSVGITRYEQVAQWTQEDIARISQMLDFKGRIERENWVEQARILASGGQTEFSRRVDKGEVETSRSR